MRPPKYRVRIFRNHEFTRAAHSDRAAECRYSFASILAFGDRGRIPCPTVVVVSMRTVEGLWSAFHISSLQPHALSAIVGALHKSGDADASAKALRPLSREIQREQHFKQLWIDRDALCLVRSIVWILEGGV